MSAALEPRYLEVWLHDIHVGWLCEAGRATRFVPTENYMADPHRPTLSLSLTVPGNEEVTREVLGNPFHPAMYSERGELPPFFAGLLPEGPLRKRLAATRKNARDTDDFGILAAAGEDLPGAVKVVPANLAKLTGAARAYGVTGGADNLEISVPEAAAEGAAAISGLQNKIALSSAHEGRRFVLPVRGHLSDIIAKLPLPGDDSQIFNEYTAMTLASKAGVNVAVCEPRPMSHIDMPDLVEALGAGTHFLAVERFDRTPGGSTHMEDACQMQTLMPNRKYGEPRYFVNLLRVLDRLGVRGIEDIRQFFIRQAANTLLGNADAHLKNFSVIYHNGVKPELSPAYDIVCVTALANFKGFATNVAIDERQRTETLATYRAVAREAGIAERVALAAVRATVEQAQELWPKALQDMNAPRAVAEEIRMRLKTLPLAQLK
jgi:serine/threonine-protein kinase HipA